ncbi:TPA: sigma 54-interacting transcriptional regulator [Burkholderia cepacia ATCC 25416]|nr:sigma 54-interacting transcriptional regulator [Burkholderia cepacia]HDR9759622.1 sigma 54-interacting transcriptional regulator [Burkholderia cepacia ATCC 25416]HDV6368178.1 sigma 54-interacting transcriptional regulator [Burkholderia cepacia]
MRTRTAQRQRTRRQPFVAVNCGALPSELLEPELFGVEKGAYTSVRMSRKGRFERANAGTLFLDEIGELSLGAQTRLLRVLQEGEIEHLGDTTTRRIDVRLVAATNIDLEKAVGEGRFHKDLYCRINAYPVVIPPLRDRKEDIPFLSRHFLGELSTREGKRIASFTGNARLALSEYEWPGNVRELRNVIERGVILTSDGELVDVQSLFPQLPASRRTGKSARPSRDGGISSSDDDIVNQFIEHALNRKMRMEDVETLLANAAIERSQRNLIHAARLLGVSRAQIAYRVSKRIPPTSSE